MGAAHSVLEKLATEIVIIIIIIIIITETSQTRYNVHK
jgi:hypothetical protein